ncbi:unnamed protein product [Arabidopsis halleri]
MLVIKVCFWLFSLLWFAVVVSRLVLARLSVVFERLGFAPCPCVAGPV